MMQDSLWQKLANRFEQQLVQQNLPHAIMFVGAMEEPRINFMNQCAQQLGIYDHQKCLITSEKEDGVIKVDQIRELQYKVSNVLIGMRLLVMIPYANRMNRAAANALLKILEEPPNAVYFFLGADQLTTIIPTIRSRCACYYLPTPLQPIIFSDIMRQYLNDWCDVLRQERSACSVAQEWLKNNLFVDVLDNIYVLLGLLVKSHIQNNQLKINSSENFEQYLALVDKVGNRPILMSLWGCIDHIQDLLRYAQSNIAINNTLAIESLLVFQFIK